jgi:N-acetyltransferase 10
MASTINGYEGTGRSLSLKLLQQLREGTAPTAANGTSSSASAARALREIKLETPIRYGPSDAVEAWLNGLLCLDATTTPHRGGTQGSPLPAQCDLFAVDRDTLFSFHPASEVFLQRMMALYVASHYKNSPNDLQLMSDAPQHRLFVLLPPIRPGENDDVLPDPLVVLQVALEGRISKESILGSLTRGQRAGGDLIPWTMSQQVRRERARINSQRADVLHSSRTTNLPRYRGPASCASPCTPTMPRCAARPCVSRSVWSVCYTDGLRDSRFASP